MRLTLVLVLLAPLPLLISACGDDVITPPVSTPRSTVVEIRDAASDRPVPGVKVVPMATATNRPLAGPLVTDEDGVCDFGDTLGEPWSMLVFGGGNWRVFGATATATEVTADTTRALIRVAPLPAPGRVHISGKVIDADTDEPLARAFVSSNPYPAGYVDGTTPGDDVTVADGAFRVSEVLFAQVPGTENLIQAVPLFVTREGYVPRGWRYRPRRGERVDEVFGVEIRLQKDDGAPRGALNGRVVRSGEPVPGVVVGLGASPIVPLKAGPGVVTWTAVSDTDGVFRFVSLPAGRYVLHPGFLPRDGVFYFNQEANVPRVVEADATLDAGDFAVVWEMYPLVPPSGSRVPARTREFRWEGVPGAATYRFVLDGGDPVWVSDPVHRLPEDRLLPAGPHYWSVIALDGDGLAVGTFGETAEFIVLADEGL